jgi:hypothetical protein
MAAHALAQLGEPGQRRLRQIIAEGQGDGAAFAMEALERVVVKF